MGEVDRPRAGPRRLRTRLRGLPGFRVMHWAWQMLIDREFREVARLQRVSPENVFQPWGTTFSERYPHLFELIAERLDAATPLQLLSFGCSTGEEAFTLRRFLPNASIIGIDVSPRRIAICRRRAQRLPAVPPIAFLIGGSADAVAAQSCDAVVAMSVFRHADLNDAPPRCDHRIRFADFERTVASLARCVKPGGLLAIRHANFRFADVDAAKDFVAIWAQRRKLAPVYGRDDCLLPGEIGEQVLFRRNS